MPRVDGVSSAIPTRNSSAARKAPGVTAQKSGMPSTSVRSTFRGMRQALSLQRDGTMRATV